MPNKRPVTYRSGEWVITLHPTGAVSIRTVRERVEWLTTIEAIYHMAVKRTLAFDGAPRKLPRKG